MNSPAADKAFRRATQALSMLVALDRKDLIERVAEQIKQEPRKESLHG